MSSLWLIVVDPGTTTGVLSGFLNLHSVAEMGGDKALSEALALGSVVPLDVKEAGGWAEGAVRLRDLVDVTLECAADDGVGVHLVIEDFLLRTADRRRETLDPIRVTSGLLALLTSDMGVELVGSKIVPQPWEVSVVLQQPSDAKSRYPNERLREAGLWVVGSTHKRDAVRHAALFLRKASFG